MAEFHDVYKEIQIEFEKRFKPFIETTPVLNELFRYVQEKIDRASVVDQSSQEFKVLYFLYRQIIEEFKAILILSTNGFSRGATILLRSMFEHCTTLVFLQKGESGEIDSKGDTIQRFIDYRSVSRRKEFIALKAAYDGEILADEFIHIENDYLRVKDQFSTEDCRECGTRRLAISWAKRDTVSMAKAAEMPQALTYFCYSEAIAYAHPSVAYIEKRMEETEGGWSYRFSSVRDEWKTLYNAHLMTLIASEAILKFLRVEDVTEYLSAYAQNWRDCWDAIRPHDRDSDIA